ncbi:F-box only protein 41-like [Zalophus californianus]|uniref:F-box only protein 41-like n=1 Tax=Zalophus californianus TaxID=9704 RepID=A0A6J2EW53_ZALCA|nr:F-box only protein 41-like [Zalophus californianus]XP_027469808.1 F-box only protein 41-like [Zalophus californianus]
MERRRRLQSSLSPPPPPRLAPGDPSSRRLSFSARRRHHRSGEGSELDPPRPRRGVGEESGPGGRAQGGRGGAAWARAPNERACACPQRRDRRGLRRARRASRSSAPQAQLPRGTGVRGARRLPQPLGPALAGGRGRCPPNGGAGKGWRADRWGTRRSRPPPPGTGPTKVKSTLVSVAVIFKAGEQSLETLDSQMKYSARASGGFG